MYPYVFVAGPNKHDNLPVSSLSRKLHHTPLIRWSACRAMPELRYLRASYISMDALPLNIFPRLRVLVLYTVNNCDFIIKNSYHSLTSLMLVHIPFQHTSGFLESLSLRFLSLFDVETEYQAPDECTCSDHVPRRRYNRGRLILHVITLSHWVWNLPTP